MSTSREGPTPAGGVRSTLWLYDEGGAETDDPERAASGELIEYAPEGDEIARTYFTPQPEYADSVWLGSVNDGLRETGNEPDLGNDGPKAAWDIWHVEDGMWLHPVRTMAELVGAQGWAHQSERTLFGALANFVSLPVWDGAPDELKREVYSWLEAHRQE